MKTILANILGILLKGLGKFLGFFLVYQQGKKSERLDNERSKNKKARDSDRAQARIRNSSNPVIDKFFDGLYNRKEHDE